MLALTFGARGLLALTFRARELLVLVLAFRARSRISVLHPTLPFASAHSSEAFCRAFTIVVVVATGSLVLSVASDGFSFWLG